MKEYIVTTEQGANQQLHELIRCKYCKYNPEKRRGCPMAECPMRNDDSFCSWAVMGEMKEE